METKIPGKETFELCEKKNPHGGGISWISKGKVHFKKGIEAAEIYEIAKEFGTPCIAHFRISTIGGTPKELCHPFPVTKKCPLDLQGEGDSVLFHNGVWQGWEKLCFQTILNKNGVYPSDVMSDSRAMAWVTAHCNPSWLNFIPTQKVVIQTKDTRLYFGSWEQDDETWYSNLYWKPKKYEGYKYSTYKYDKDSEDAWWDNYQKTSGATDDDIRRMRCTNGFYPD
jgi:hypothetical protein